MKEQLLPHRAPSAGAVVKKILAVNPALQTDAVIAIVRQAIRTQGGGGEFSKAEVIDEEHALRLARETLQ